ncbi:MAG TPA: DnaB-like helicase C-terminal domain-containing protein [Candidatus Kapabacteria bacterium]|nr:DnaB-like helicase C-terminal domain-containing protein [Candidatus Kapabacteria bacterium]
MDQTIVKPNDEIEIPSSDSDDLKMIEDEETIGISTDKTYEEGTTNVSGAAPGGDEFQETIINAETLEKAKENVVIPDKTSILFGISDIQKKLDNEIANIPEEYEEHLEPEQMSHIIKDHLPSDSEAERIKVNRNFLKDAEPFRLESLAENLKNTHQNLPTGFKSLDQFITIPFNALSLIVSRPKHGKTCFMLNVLLNMCHSNPGKHFLFYTYEEPRWDVFLKLINISGAKQFTMREEQQSNLERWEYEFNRQGIDELKKKANEDLEYSGLKNFIKISDMIHVIDSNHNCFDLIDSIRSFGKTFDVGAVFIDSLPKIKLDEKRSMDRRQQLQEISDNLRKFASEIRHPIILSASLTTGSEAARSPEYDELIEENLADCGSPGQNASLIIGLQNYSRSKFIGSNVNNKFKSIFLDEPLKKAELMPDNLKDMVQKTFLLSKVMSNKIGPEPETELIFHKQLLKITDFHAEALKF